MQLLDMPVIQVALAVIISWAMFAILVSLVQEAIAQLISERGRFMKMYLLKQLSDAPNGINWGNLLYLHGAVDLLIREPNKPTNDIQPRLFAQVLIEVLGKSHVAQMKIIPNSYQNPALKDFKNALSTLQQSDVLTFLRMAMNNAELKDAFPGRAPNESIVYEQLLVEIENWYRQFLERLNLWYKKRMRQRLFIIGLIGSVLLNVDSIQLFNFYQVHPESRVAVERYYKNYIQETDDKHPVKTNYSLQLTAASLDSLAKAAALPVGFDYSFFNKRSETSYWAFWKIAGLLISAFAAALGAPFWFDVLRKAYTRKLKII